MNPDAAAALIQAVRSQVMTASSPHRRFPQGRGVWSFDRRQGKRESGLRAPRRKPFSRETPVRVPSFFLGVRICKRRL
jgi:hypothetical protein